MKQFTGSKIILLATILSYSSLSNAQEVMLQSDSAMKKRVIKMEFFSPLTGNLTLGYERYIKNFTSIELK